MKFKTFSLITFVCMSLANGLKAQENAKSISFFKNSGVVASNRDEADYIREITDPEPGLTLYSVIDMYKNGGKRLVGKSLQKEHVQFEGIVEYYYPAGNLKEKANYKAGKRTGYSYIYYPDGKLYAIMDYLVTTVGEWENYNIIEYHDQTGKEMVSNGNGYFKSYAIEETGFYEEGKVKNKLRDGEWKGHLLVNNLLLTFTEVYQNGELLSGSNVDPDGKLVRYSKRIKSPEFTGGIEAFTNFLIANITYPKYARKRNITGKVFLSFVVNSDGSIEELKVVSSPAPELSNEAKRVIQKSPNWQPGEHFGLPVRVQYTLPINFTLDD